ncbi:MAG: helicase [Bifidobacteriaceae bacterium]|nr:helicase [Bifidobacteriaceae bacterium]
MVQQNTGMGERSDMEQGHQQAHDQAPALSSHQDPAQSVPLPRPLAQSGTIRGWVEDYSHLILADPLKDFTALDASLDLTKAHPSGTAQLFATGEAHLSSLFREASSLTAAERDLGRVYARKSEAQAAYGFGAISLIAGVAKWAQGKQQMPVLLYPIDVDRSGEERMSRATLRIWDRVNVNPELVSALKLRGVSFDPIALLKASEYEDGVVNTSIALAKIASLASRVIDGFGIDHVFVVGCFVNPATMIARRATSIVQRLEASPSGLPVLDAIAGDATAINQLKSQPSVDAQADSTADADPHDEFEVGDVPNPVRFAAREVARGASIFLNAPSNSTSSKYALAIASRAIAAGKTVLYAPCVGSQKNNFLREATRLGLGPLVLDATDPDFKKSVDARLVGAVSASGTHQAASSVTRYNQLADELVGIRSRLSRYFGDLHEEKSPWGVSAYQTIENLAKVSALPSQPRTRVRLSADTARQLNGKLSQWGAKLIRAGQLGEYTLEPADTAWFKASLLSTQDAESAYQRVVQLLDTLLPHVREQIRSTVETCGFPVPDTVAEWGRQVATLQNLRRVLDVFTPAIFERDLSSMLTATLSKPDRKAQGIEMGFWERRRYVKEVKSLLRPGVKVEDLHEALGVVARQAVQWHELVPHGGWPVLPPKLDAIIETFESLTADLTALDVVLSTTPEGSDLTSAQFVALEARLKRLYDDHASLADLPERTNLEHEFEQVGLTGLVDDLHDRAIAPESAPDELQLAWWTTVFETIVHSSDMIANQDGSLLTDTTERFTDLDLEHIESVGPLINQELTKRLSDTLYARSQDANQLHAVLSGAGSSESVQSTESMAKTPHDGLTGPATVSVASLRKDYPTLMSFAKPLFVATPANLAASYAMASLADIVIVDACAHAPAAEFLSVLSYAPQAVVIADKATASCPAVLRAATLLPTIDSGYSRVPLNPDIASFLRDNGYPMGSYPTGADFHAQVGFSWVDAKGVPLRGSGLVETTSEEIDEVVAIVERRAAQMPVVPAGYALSVVTLTQAHASLVADAFERAAQKNRDVAMLLPHIEVADIANVAGMTPGDVILSTSFGKTTHGKLLQQFGVIEQPGGAKRLLDVLALVNGDFDIVAGFTSDDLEDERLTQPGSQMLKRLLQWAENLGTGEVPMVAHPEEASVLLSDLAARLRARGYATALGYGYDDGRHLPLVVGKKGSSDDAETNFSVAVFTDDTQFMKITSLRQRHRYLSEELAVAGWKTVHVWSVGAFVNPDREVDRIAALLEDVAGVASSTENEASEPKRDPSSGGR